MKDQLVKFWKDEEGATAIEYALIAGLIAVIIIAAFSAFGDGIIDLFTNIGGKLGEAATDVGTTDLPSGT